MPNALAKLYSWADGVKRRVSNPLETILMGLARAGEDFQDASRDTDVAYGLNGMKSVLVTPQQRAQAAQRAADFGAQHGMAAATVWHGSPHKFDKFDSSKIGTGEGAQAYGHGLYLADSPGVAKSYQENLRPMRLKVGDSWVNGGDDIAMVATTLDGASSPQAVKAAFLKDAQRAQHLADTSGSKVMAKKAESARRWASMVDDVAAKMGGKPVVEELGDGHLYKVDLPDEKIARMLDWDKPLSQQPEAVAELATVFGLPSQTTGAQAYDALTKKFGTGVRETLDKAGQSSAASVLRQRGIPGIRYLDGGSRGAGQGTSNYVVFPGNEDILTILERNGVPVK